MFVLKEEYEVRWPVRVKVPVDGGIDERLFTGVFRVPLIEDLRGWSQDDLLSSTGLLKRTFTGWLEDFRVTEDGPPARYSDELRDRLISMPFVHAALARALAEIVLGIAPPKAAEGQSPMRQLI